MSVSTKTVKDLKAAPYNPRKISDAQLKRLKKSMEKFGDLGGIVVNVKTGHVVGGHQRLKHLDPGCKILKKPAKDGTGTVAIGTVQTPFGTFAYREVDWDEQKEIAANVAANQHGGEFDIPKLKEILASLDDGEFDMDLVGFDEKELEDLATGPAGEAGEVKFAEELNEENNYIVLQFKTTTDWLNAMTVFGLDSAYARRRDGKPWAKGIGRVLHGPDAIEKIKNG